MTDINVHTHGYIRLLPEQKQISLKLTFHVEAFIFGQVCYILTS